MRDLLASCVLALCLLLSLRLPASADPMSSEIARNGLAKVEARLSAIPAPTPNDLFTLGGVQFLRAVELSFQDRWHNGMTDRTGMLPFLRLPLDANPNPAAFDPAALVGIFIHAGDKLAEARATLSKLPDTAPVNVQIALDDLWFDVNMNGTRDPGEAIANILGSAVLGGSDDVGMAPHPLPIIQFDIADAAWLAAYADLLSALCDIARAYDPTEPLTRITRTHDAMAALGPLTPDPFFGGGDYDPARLDGIDLFAVILASLNQPPDKARMTSAHAHLLAMAAENRQFWARVAQETDDTHEWLPNDNQHAALGIEVPQGTGPAWLAVLTDVEAVLNGEKLLPFWRAGPPAGFNLRKFFENPMPIDIAGWVQGWGVLPYLDKGSVVSSETTDRFDSLMQGQTMLFALYLN